MPCDALTIPGKPLEEVSVGSIDCNEASKEARPAFAWQQCVDAGRDARSSASEVLIQPGADLWQRVYGSAAVPADKVPVLVGTCSEVMPTVDQRGSA